ncbi:sugar transferase [Psychrilyobacter atlanticus]|uniref:sugar transferase n=1 Tax=Psychrilyobacter atlanticus TaxID=271091 RepID=UPI00042A8F32|nr:sugar transferase [Psychrilyobacter atlanticus]
MYKKYFKRLFDILGSLVLLVTVLPILIIIATLIKNKIGSPVLFCQDRPGLNEKIFKMYKFRSMTNEKDKNGNLLPDEKRLTKFGLILRKSSIDELPAIINVLKGDMSFIGPRPLLVKYLPYYKETEKKRHSVRPGITGLAQVNGRNFLDWDKRFELDIKYVKNLFFILDMKILIKTILKVVLKKDVAEVTNYVMKDLNVERKKI